MADFAATAGKTDDMTHANAKIVPPTRHENRMAARAYALVMRWLVRLAALITVAILVFLIGYILVNGIPNLKPSLFEWTYNSDNVSLMPALINTILMTAFSLAIATPLGIFAAVWLVEYAKRGQQAGQGGAHHHRNAAGHPLHRIRSVRYAVLCHAAQMGLQPDRRCLHAGHHGAAGHHAHHRGSAACSAGFLPRGQLWPGGRQAAHRIHHCAAQRHAGHPVRRDFGNGRIVGETAALIYTASTVAAVPASVFSSTRTLATHMYLLSNEGLHINETYGTAVVLLILVLLINSLSSSIAGRLAKK